ncbi:MAG: HigA family addiction module antitoxin [Desulfococcaceae bacterium]
MNEKKISPVHPGETLLKEFLEPMGISTGQIAEYVNVPEMLIKEITEGKKPVTADTALRLGRYFGISPRFWMGMQAHYDLAVAEDEMEKHPEQEIRTCQRMSVLPILSLSNQL